MGRRSRKRGGAATPARPQPEETRSPRAASPARRPRVGHAGSRAAGDPPPRSPSRRPRSDEAPAAPWAPFPLVELCILLALVMIALGFFTAGARGRALFGAGLALVSLSALELTIREHFAGYRSHSALLAGAGAVAIGALLFFLAGTSRAVVLVCGAATFATLWRLLRASFIRRSGVGFRA